jgi:diacylglycerol kinase
MSYFKERRTSFGFALDGFKAAFNEPNFRIQLLVAMMVLFLGIGFGISLTEWFAVIISCGLVLALELVNSGMERLCDMTTRESNADIKYIKDVCAAAVLVASFAAAVVGIIVFAPRIIALFS